MKKTLIIGAMCIGAVSAYSQGSVLFENRQSDMTIHIFAPQLATPSVETLGYQGSAVSGSSTGGVTTDISMSGGNPVYGGSTVFTGGAIGNTLTSSPTPAGAYNYNNGSDYTVELYAAPGANAAASALQPITYDTSVIYTSPTLGGIFKNNTANNSLGSVNAPVGGDVASLELVVWYNGGTGQTLAQDQADGAPWGFSNEINYTSGTPPGTPPSMEGLESFSLVTAPEPSTIALGVIGASSLLFRRRK